MDRFSPLLVALGMLTAAATSGCAQDTQALNGAGSSIPNAMVSEILNLPMNKTEWRLDQRYRMSDGIKEEYVPVGETGQNWSQMVTTRLLPSSISPQIALSSLLQTYRTTCKKTEVLSSSQGTRRDATAARSGISDTYNVFDALIYCDTPDRSKVPSNVPLRRYEAVWFKGLVGRAGNYWVQRAWHSNDAGPESILTSARERMAWKTWIAAVGLEANRKPTR